MSTTKPEVDWFHFPKWWSKNYGLLNLAGKWAVVQAKAGMDSMLDDDYEVITQWVDDRKTAIGFLKLLMENES